MATKVDCRLPCSPCKCCTIFGTNFLLRTYFTITEEHEFLLLWTWTWFTKELNSHNFQHVTSSNLSCSYNFPTTAQALGPSGELSDALSQTTPIKARIYFSDSPVRPEVHHLLPARGRLLRHLLHTVHPAGESIVHKSKDTSPKTRSCKIKESKDHLG